MSLTFIRETPRRTKSMRKYVLAMCSCGVPIEIQKCRFREDRSCNKCIRTKLKADGKGIYRNKNQQIKELKEKIVELENEIQSMIDDLAGEDI